MSVPIIVTDNPRFFIYADGELVYGADIEGYNIVSCKAVLESNKAGSLKFDIPVGSEMYGNIKKLKTTVELRQGNDILFRGRLLNTSREIKNTLSYYCEGFLSWLVDIQLNPYTFSGSAATLFQNYLTEYNSRASDNRKIVFKSSDITTSIGVTEEDYSSAWDQVKKVMINGVGGFVVPSLSDSETGVMFLSEYGASSSQVIQFGRNMIDFDEYIDASEIFTAIRPLGKKINDVRVSLPEGFVTNQTAIDAFGRIERTIYFDEIEDESTLRTAAQNYLNSGIQSAMTLTIKAIDLHLLDVDVDRISLGDSVRVVSVPHNIDAYFICTKIEIDVLNPQNTVYTFGATQRTISELTNPTYRKYVITEGA